MFEQMYIHNIIFKSGIYRLHVSKLMCKDLKLKNLYIWVFLTQTNAYICNVDANLHLFLSENDLFFMYQNVADFSMPFLRVQTFLYGTLILFGSPFPVFSLWKQPSLAFVIETLQASILFCSHLNFDLLFIRLVFVVLSF